MIKFIIYLITYFMSFFMITQNNKVNQQEKIKQDNTFEFDTKEFTGVKANSKTMEVILDDSYTIPFNKYIKSNNSIESIKDVVDLN